MSRSRDRSYLWVYYVAAGLLFAGAVFRSLLVVEDNTVLRTALLLLLAWLALFVSEIFISRIWRPWFMVCLALQSAIVAILVAQPGHYDFYAVLFGVLAMQAFQRLGLWPGVAYLAAFVPLMAVPLFSRYEPAEAATFVLIYTAVNVFLGYYALATRRATEARAANQAAGRELEAANLELRDYVERLERLAVAEERNRVARDLHDSVTQTIFSMTLASQSAAILLEREPERVDIQLERLGQLTQSALAEMRALVSELRPDGLAEGGLQAGVRRDIERRARDGFSVSLEMDDAPGRLPGDVGTEAVMSIAEERGLLRIVQEALNNAVKHSGVTEATVRLRLRPPLRIEVEDRGRGFDAGQARGGSGMGLTSMSERASEIGWDLEVRSESGKGTEVIVERPGEGGR
ncbi:MAG: hypothetical protein A2133_00410 [Actinobacteria bacterium RBG_16_64_13]|nr:MAG: hypothetical protein A2133_00410 [Actinobacteria bacterium RBG_16_64_13]